MLPRKMTHFSESSLIKNASKKDDFLIYSKNVQKLVCLLGPVKDIDRSFLYIFSIKKFHGNIVFFVYESIYHWKGNYIILILVKILLKKISYFGCY